jgi:acetate kinase
MLPALPCVLSINGGSSSIRFAVYAAGGTRRLAGKIERIGSSGATLAVDDAAGRAGRPRRVAATDHRAAAGILLDWLEAQPVFASIRAVGHRVVHGMRHSRPERVTPRLLAELRRLGPYDPDHLPEEIALIDACRERHPRLPQVACFDTAFHRAMPRLARLLPIPRRYAAKGVERYGFHGLSYAYLLEELRRLDPAAARGRVIFAHLGSGASLAAVHRGKSRDTSMGFTPAAGLVMGTRSGDLDPGLGYFLARTERMTPAGFQQMVNHQSGLLGVSGTSSDLRDLSARASTDARAAEAVELFCYQARKWIGAFAAALGGLDTLVFSAGIGENAPRVRARICRELGFLGLALDPRRNARNAPLISRSGARVRVRVIRTNEELMIARSVGRLLALGDF